MALIRKRRVVAVAVEATAGTAETLDATDAAFNAYSSEFTPNVPMSLREGQSALSPLLAMPGAKMGTIVYETDLYTAPAWESHLQCAGLAEDSPDIWTPTTVSSEWKTATVGVYMDGKYYEIVGAMCDIGFRFRAGQPTRMVWTWTGALGDWGTDVAILAPTFPLTAASAPRFASSTTTLGGSAIAFSALDFNLGNQVAMLEDPNTDSGYSRAWINTRAPGGTIDLEEALAATRNDVGDWLTPTTRALSLAYASMSLSVPKFQFTNAPTGDRNGASVVNATFQAIRNATGGDDEFSLDLTTA